MVSAWTGRPAGAHIHTFSGGELLSYRWMDGQTVITPRSVPRHRLVIRTLFSPICLFKSVSSHLCRDAGWGIEMRRAADAQRAIGLVCSLPILYRPGFRVGKEECLDTAHLWAIL